MGKKSKKRRFKENRHRGLKKQNNPLKFTIRINMPNAGQYATVFQMENLEQNIGKLNNLDLKEVSNDVLKNAINDVISYKPDPTASHSVVKMMSCWRQINKNGNLYRVRICEEDCCKTMYKDDDAWNPPKEKAKHGRLNEENDSLLYVAEDMETAIKEMKVANEQCFWLIVYDIKNDLRVTTIGEPTNQEGEYTPIHNRISEFLRQEFTRDVLPGNEFEYKVSNIIAKWYYPFNDNDGWSYPSVANEGASSLCLDPKNAKEKLMVKYAIHYTKNGDDIIPNYIGTVNQVGLFEHTLAKV